MKVAVVGASGNVGKRVVAELTSRGHEVTAISRHPEGAPTGPKVTPKVGDAENPEALAKLIAGHDAVVSSLRFSKSDSGKLIDAVHRSGVKRYLVVGGAGSLEVAPGQLLIDQPYFPEASKTEASAGAAFLGKLKGDKELDWTFLSPSAIFVAGERTGKFRTGKDQLLTSAELGKSTISYEDYSIALVDEIEKPAHSRQRFTVGY